MENNFEQKKEKMKEEAREFSKSPWMFFTRKRKLTSLIVVFLLIFGITTIKNIPRELNPEVEIPIALVVTAYPGASPLDVEEQITDKIESQISDLEGIKNLTSSSSLGISSITVEFEAGEDLDKSIRKLKDEVDGINDLPEDSISPNVVEISLSDQPILTAVVAGNNYDIVELKNFADNLKDSLEGISYVSEVRVVGGREKEIKVDVDGEKLSKYGLSLSQIISKISANDFNFPLGSIEVENSKYALRMEGEFSNAQEIGSLIVGYNNEKPVCLEDVAKVSETLNEETSKSRITIGNQNSSEAVSIQVYKKTGGDITKVAEEIKKRIKNGKGEDYPEGVEAVITLDLSSYISDSINTLSANGLQTIILILILLFVFLGWKEALIAGISVPFSFFVAFITMSLFGESLNFLSLFSLVLALGLLVDSAVVIVEGMYEKVSRHGLTGFQSAALTVKEYAAPLLSGMLTTVAAFFPLLFVIGIFGQFIKTIPVVVIATLTAALFVSLTIIPAVGSIAMNPVNKNGNGKNKLNGLLSQSFFAKICRKVIIFCKPKPRNQRMFGRVFETISQKYSNYLPELVSEKKKRIKLIVSVWVLLIVSAALPFIGVLKIQSFVPSDGEYFFVNLEMPNGTVLEKTDETTKKIEEVIKEEPEVVNFITSVGSSLGFSGGISSSSGNAPENVAFIQVNLTKKEDRKEKSFEITSRIRKKLNQEITAGEVTVEEEESGPPSGSPIEVKVEGEDLLALSNLAEKIKNELADIPTVIDAKTSLEETSGELVFIPNKDVVARKGLTLAQIGGELRNYVNRNNNEEIKKQGDEIKINIGADSEKLNNLEAIKDLPISLSTGGKVLVSELGEIILKPSVASIRHFDQNRTITVSANTDGGNSTEITNLLKEKINSLGLPSGYKVNFGGESEELAEVFSDMFAKMIIGIILILFILIIQFNSYRQVFIILFTIPLAMIGVFWGMALARLTIDIPSFIGIVSLSGIVVNNAIILIDEINRKVREANSNLVEAVCSAGKTRFRPVILTTITTVFGLLPLSITQPDWRNMGFTIIFGLIFASFLTLFIVPAMYISFHNKKTRKEGI